MAKTVLGPDGKPRCGWCTAAPEFFDYHDKEWGYPVGDDIRLFEKLCLESFQSGLSWRTILAKRENFRAAFHHFDFNKVAEFSSDDVEKLLQNEGSLAAYFWRHEPKEMVGFEPQSLSTSDVSKALSKDLKKRGWKFVGPTTLYAFLQAMGLINDNATDCVYRVKVEEARQAFKRPIDVR